MFYLLAVITGVFSIASLLPIWRHESWLIRALDFPRLQFSAVLFFCLLLQFLYLDFSQVDTWFLFLITLICLGYQICWILPFTPLFPQEVAWANDDAGESLKLIIANVKTSNRNAAALLQLLEEYRPDVLLTLETDDWWQDQLACLEADYPHTMKCPLDNLYGMHLYSQLPLSDSHVEFLVEDDKPSFHTVLEMASGRKVQAHFLHPAPPSPTENEESSERDAELLVVARSINEQQTLPILVAGDLNDVAWSITTRLFKKISGLHDPRVGRGMFNSFHAEYWFLRWPLDHLFHSHHFSVKSMRRLNKIGSDHFPIYSELIFMGRANGKSQEIDAEREEREWAKQKHREEGVSKQDVPKPGQEDSQRRGG